MITASTHSAPNWVDLSTTDIDSALSFYRELLGWTIEKSTTPMGDYYIGKLPDREIGGMMAAPEDEKMPPMWTMFIYVENVDTSVDRVRDAGGIVLEKPFDIPDGRVSIVADPTGGMFGLISGPAPEGTWLSQDVGAICWVELLTRDVATAETFYGQVFDWKAETKVYEDFSYTTFTLDGDQLAGMMMMPDEVPIEAPSHWAVYFTVANCEQAGEKVKDLGGKVIRPAEKIEMGHFAVIEDPQGAIFQLMDFEE